MVNLKLGLVVFLFFIFSSSAYGLGIGPGRMEMDFKPNLRQPLTISVFNSVDDYFPVEVSVSGELAEYTDFKKQTVILDPLGSKDFKFNLNLPSKLERPGNHTLYITARQTDFVGSSGDSPSTVGALVAVRTELIVFVPFDGPYIDAKFNAPNVEAGNNLPFSVLIRNLGNEPVSDIQGVIRIQDANGDEVGYLDFKTSLGLSEEKDVKLEWDTSEQSSGIYLAYLTIDYDKGGKYETNTEFRLGSYYISILKLQKFIEKGRINEYDSLILSTWNSAIDNVYTELEIDYNGQKRTFKSESFELGSWENKSIRLFIDARGMESGVYPSKFSVYYPDGSNYVDFDLKVGSKINILIYVAAGALVLVALVLLILFRNKIFKKKRNKK